MLTGLITRANWGKSSFGFSNKPKFIDAFIDTISFKPSEVKCPTVLTISNPRLNNS